METPSSTGKDVTENINTKDKEESPVIAPSDPLESYFSVKKTLGRANHKIGEDSEIFPLTTLLNKAQSEEWCIGGREFRFHTISFRKDDGTKVNLIKEDKVKMKTILKLSEQASFGYGSETVYDPNVRSARFIPGDRLEVRKQWGSVNMPSSLLKFAPLGYFILPVLSKMHIYGPGDFFETHRDTPRSIRHFGTLTVGVGPPHTGGEMTFGTNASDPSNSEDTSQFFQADRGSWAAWFVDTPHRIYPVKTGHRITLQYDLFCVSQLEIRYPSEFPLGNKVPPGSDISSVADGYMMKGWDERSGLKNTLDMDNEETVRAAEEFAAELAKWTPQKEWGIVLRHWYPFAATEKMKSDPSGLLRGADYSLWKSLSKDFDCSFLIGIFRSDYEQDSHRWRNQIYYCALHPEDLYPQKKESRTFIELTFIPAKRMGKVLQLESQHNDCYTGNEGPESLYFYSAVVLRAAKKGHLFESLKDESNLEDEESDWEVEDESD